MNELNDEAPEGSKGDSGIPAYKVAMLGSSGVGKTALTYQFTTSEYICAYDLSLDDDYGQKTVSVLLNGQETDLEVVDHPACEMSVSIHCPVQLQSEQSNFLKTFVLIGNFSATVARGNF